MRFLTLARKPLILVVGLTALFVFGGGSRTTLADGTTISPSQATAYYRLGAWSDSGATLSENIDTSQNEILISDDSVLCASCIVKVDNEYMLIIRFVEGDYHQPDTMFVLRGIEGTTRTGHGSGTKLKERLVTVGIRANNITDSWGLGGFSVDITVPSGMHFVSLVPQTAWLTSTGRTLANCDGFHADGSSTWYVSCSTTGNPGDSGHPLGPKGSGSIATMTLEQYGDTIDTEEVPVGGELANTTGASIPATGTNLTVQVQRCPDTNLDNKVDSFDMLQVAKSILDRGEDSGATLTSQVDTPQTSIPISGQGSLVAGDTIAIDTEQMTVLTIQTNTMTVTRGVNNTKAGSHVTGAVIYRGTVDGNGDGKLGYTRLKDISENDQIDSNDMLTVARTLVTKCPVP